MARPVAPVFYCTDASMKGYQSLASPVAPAEVLDAALYEERSRFVEVFEPVTHRDEDSVRGTAAEAVDLCDISFAAWHDSACPLVRPRGSDAAKVHRGPRDVKLFNTLSLHSHSHCPR